MKELVNNLKFVWKYCKKKKGDLVLLMLVSMIEIVLSIITPMLSARIIIELTSNNYIRIILVAFVIFVVNFTINIFEYISRRCSIIIYRNTLSLLEIELGRNILKLENACLDEVGSGVFIQRLTNDTSRIADVFNLILRLLSEVIRYFGILVAIFIINKIVFGYVLLMLVILQFIERVRTNKLNVADKITRGAKEKVSGFIGELVRGARDIKMLNSESDFIDELGKRIDYHNYQRLKMQKTSWSYRLVMGQIKELCYFILIILLVIFMKDGILVPAVALVLYNYCSNLSGSIYLIGNLLEYIKDFNLSSERVYEIISSSKFKKEEFGMVKLEKINGDFEFKDVFFGYGEKVFLKGLNFKINANETVAFVGKSGVGKTTIFNLLCKMYDNYKGSITIDGVDIKELDKDSIRGNITIISQNPYIFNMSIRDNLRLVKADLTDEEMIEACKIACLDDFIAGLSNGYDTIVGEGGVNLSGGQKQRLAIARALIQKTEIILFDEATSALDNETQEKIQAAIDNMKNEYTILIIAHRLSTIRNADRIYYLNNGRVEASGTHIELLKCCKGYKRLYDSRDR